MTMKEAHVFASRVAIEASETIDMSSDELRQFAAAIFSSINYFNRRSREHDNYMQYMALCEAQQEQARLELEEEKRRRKQALVIVK